MGIRLSRDGGGRSPFTLTKRTCCRHFRLLPQVSDTFLVSLEKLVVMLVENFPRLNRKFHLVCFAAVLKVLLALAPKGSTFRGFLSKIGECTKQTFELKILHTLAPK